MDVLFTITEGISLAFISHFAAMGVGAMLRAFRLVADV